MLLEDGKCIAQIAPAEHVDVEVASTVRVWAEDATAERALDVLERLEVAAMHADLEGGLLPVAGEGTFADDEAHGVAETERVHWAAS